MTGRPSLFTEELSATICERIASGESLAAICRDDAMPGYSTVITWLRTNDSFQADYARAREAQADADADAINDVAWRTLKGEFDPQSARVLIDSLKWTAAKRQPKKYGDKLDVTSGGKKIEGVTMAFVAPKDADG